MSQQPRESTPQDRALLALLVLVTLAFAFVLWPFYGAILWATILAIVFAPAHRRLANSMPGHRNLAALLMVLIIVTIVLLPLAITAASLVSEATALYDRIQSGELDLGLQRFLDALPGWASRILGRLGVTDVGDVQRMVTRLLKEGSQFFATQAVLVGQGTANFIISLFLMLYLLFFFLRDGAALAQRIKDAIPLRPEQKRALFEKFAVVINAMVKGTILVAIVQGALGGLIFWALGIHAPVLWGVLMAFLSLVPALGAAIVWLPVALYLLATGAVWQGLVLMAFGAGVIGLVDNLLRPYLVGKDTRMPDYVVLISTLGGLAIFGLNGFVIGPLIAAMFIAVWDISGGAAPRRKGSGEGR
ncbi:MAG: AI-2E family transporter [Methyloceanibacter sp.]|uniref:AI-2E family transporter n=1 Tax=Methyloceanibacter sp. TaxID=1965321 RepID=UPI003D6D3BB7